MTLVDELAELDACAPVSVAKYDKKNPPSISVAALLAVAKRFETLKTLQKDTEAELNGIKADIIEAAKPVQLEMSRKYGIHIPTIKVCGLSVTCRPPHYTTKIADPVRIKEVAAMYGTMFPTMFRFVRLIPETPEIIACLKAAGIKYTMHIAPLKALHENRWKPEITSLLERTDEIKPIWSVSGSSEAQ